MLRSVLAYGSVRFLFLFLFVLRFTGRGADSNGVPGADLLSGTGETTALGELFRDSYVDLQRCSSASDSSSKSTPSSASPVAFAEIAGEL